jgi:GNAT superfamily N-acetyltransferase
MSRQRREVVGSLTMPNSGARLKDIDRALWGAVVERNLIEHYAYLGTASGATMGDEGDLLWVITGALSATQNGVVGARLDHLETRALGDRIEGVMQRFRDRRVNMSWWVGPTTTPSTLGVTLESHGLPRGGVPGLAADLYALVAPSAAMPGLEIVQVLDEAQLWQWVLVHGHDFTDESRRQHVALFASLGLSSHSPWRHFLALMDGRPVGASSLFLGSTAAGLYNVATVPDARRQGVGTAISYATLIAARAEGHTLGVLQASAAGNGVYRSLGFERCCQLWQHYWVPQ